MATKIHRPYFHSFPKPRGNEEFDFSSSPLLEPDAFDYSTTHGSSLGLTSSYVPSDAQLGAIKYGDGLGNGLRTGFVGGLAPLPSSLPSASSAPAAQGSPTSPPGLAAAFRASPAMTAPHWPGIMPVQSLLAPDLVRHLGLLQTPTRDAIAAMGPVAKLQFSIMMSAALEEQKKRKSEQEVVAFAAPAHPTAALTRSAPLDVASPHRSGFSQPSAAVGSRSEAAPGGALFVCNLPPQTNEYALLELFAPYGTVVSARVAVDKQTNALKSYGFVSFAEASSATDAMRNLNGKVMPTGHALKVEPKAAQGGSVFVANLMPGTDDEVLSDLFAPYGTIVSATMGFDKVTNTGRNYGFVNFKDAASATKAIEALDGLLLTNGKRLKVQLSTHRHADAGGTGGGAKGAPETGGLSRLPPVEPFYAGGAVSRT